MWSPLYPVNENKQVLVGLVLMLLVAFIAAIHKTSDSVAASSPAQMDHGHIIVLTVATPLVLFLDVT
jgi:hypothetical protein